jgi:hypothetical protein
MKRYLLAAAALGFSGTAEAVVNLYTDETVFTAVSGPVTVIENFEDAPLAARDIPLPGYSGPGGEISFIPISSNPVAPNVTVASPGYINFAADLNPTTTTLLTASGNENFEGILTIPTLALGFNVFLNDSPYTVTFLSGVNVLGTLTFDNPLVPGNNLGFAGITSDIPITSFQVLAFNGEQINTGVDNIRVADAGFVPEPTSWMMMILGFGAIGAALRRTRPVKATVSA